MPGINKRSNRPNKGLQRKTEFNDKPEVGKNGKPTDFMLYNQGGETRKATKPRRTPLKKKESIRPTLKDRFHFRSAGMT